MKRDSVTMSFMRRQHLHLPAILVAASLLASCASTRPSAYLDAPDSALRGCAEWFQRVDAAIDRAGMRDAGAHRLPGFPHLRSDRLLASFADDVVRDHAKFPDWLGAMRDLDQRSRNQEIRNLPATAAIALGVPDKATLRSEALRCGHVLLAADLNSPDAPLRLARASRVPDSYYSALRLFGLYPLASIPFFDGVQHWQQRTVVEFERQRTMLFDSATSIRYVPAAGDPDAENPRTLLARVRINTLGIPQFSDAEREVLLAAHAPIFEVDTRRDDDRMGTIVWRPDRMLAVEPAQPTVYRRVAFTRLGTNVQTQLIYTIWFPRRTSSGKFDPIAGELDGVVLRITLDDEGRPLIADSIHACGCYQQFFPGPQMNVRPAPEARIEWAFVPASLPPLSRGTRLAIRLAAGTHYVIRIAAAENLDGLRYATAGEDELRALPISADATRSIYGPDGLIAGSERGERFLFWPMGIASTGAMRQWGHHATAFVGRRHFDDADLIERRFEIAVKKAGTETPAR